MIGEYERAVAPGEWLAGKKLDPLIVGPRVSGEVVVDGPCSITSEKARGEEFQGHPALCREPTECGGGAVAPTAKRIVEDGNVIRVRRSGVHEDSMADDERWRQTNI
jgi:hypothetical protein